MKDLREAMHEAGAPRDDWNADVSSLIAAGQKRVRRRKIVVASIAAAAVAIVGTTAVLAGLPGLNRSDPDPVKPDKRGAYVEERLSPAEVERRCNIMLAKGNGGAATTWVAGRDDEGRAIAASQSAEPVENRVGYAVDGGPPGTPLPAEGDDPGFEVTRCTIPQESFLDRPPANPTSLPDDPQGILRTCSNALGYDLTGWTVLASQRLRPGLVAMIMSANDHAVRCDLDAGWQSANAELLDGAFLDENDEPVLPSGDTGPGDRKRYDNLELVCPRQTSCMLSGVVWGLPDGHVVELRAPDGTVAGRTTVRRGAIATVMKVVGSQSDAIVRKGLEVRVLDVDGLPVWSGRIEHVSLVLSAQMAP